MQRYIRAFLQAARMTMRGESVRQHESLWQWIEQGTALTTATFAITDKHNLDRTQLTQRLEGRDMSLETVLGGIQYHFTQEYPYLLRDFTQHSITAIYASNMNDHFFISAFIDPVDSPEIKQALQKLQQHLENAPPNPDQNTT